MIESRCGILCSECNFQQENKCGGCTRIKRPFWAEVCPVKACCETRQYQQCGECREFPCDLLNSFAYHEEQGDDGKRIEQCRKWQENNK